MTVQYDIESAQVNLKITFRVKLAGMEPREKYGRTRYQPNLLTVVIQDGELGYPTMSGPRMVKSGPHGSDIQEVLYLHDIEGPLAGEPWFMLLREHLYQRYNAVARGWSV